SFKIAAVVSREGIVEEVAALRSALGDEAELLIDLHWKFSADEALVLARELATHRPGFIEAPVKPEDHAGLARVGRESVVPVAAARNGIPPTKLPTVWPRVLSASSSRRWDTPASPSSCGSPPSLRPTRYGSPLMRPSVPAFSSPPACRYRPPCPICGSTSGNIRYSRAAWRCSKA